MSRLVIHATTITTFVNGQWHGILIRGPSGSGKSDLALRALSQGFQLVSDDYSHLWISDDQLYASAPDTIAGQIEVRGLGIVSRTFRPYTKLTLCIDCQNTSPERMPEPQSVTLLGKDLPALRLNPLEASTVSKLFSALNR
ncbi:MAG: HPr kinase/phosphatase C-terminal domain-containing protein [Asticcacaulis sp.]